MPAGKPAGVACIHLTKDFLCGIFGRADRPEVCKSFMAEKIICGENRDEALIILSGLESGVVG